MSKKAIYFLKSQEALTMGYKILLGFIIFFSIILNSSGNILYEKDNLIITDIDIKIYKDLYENNYGIKINDTNALKDLALIRNVINDLEKNNEDFIKRINDEILIKYGKNSFENINIREFIIFSKIRDEFVINYFQNKLNITEIKNIFKNLEKLNIPISSNDCLIIDKIVDLKNNEGFMESIYNNLKNDSKEFSIMMNNKKYDICIDDATFNSIERLIIEYIQSKTTQEFEAFVYGKIKN